MSGEEEKEIRFCVLIVFSEYSLSSITDIMLFVFGDVIDSNKCS